MQTLAAPFYCRWWWRLSALGTFFLVTVTTRMCWCPFCVCDRHTHTHTLMHNTMWTLESREGHRLLHQLRRTTAVFYTNCRCRRRCRRQRRQWWRWRHSIQSTCIWLASHPYSLRQMHKCVDDAHSIAGHVVCSFSWRFVWQASGSPLMPSWTDLEMNAYLYTTKSIREMDW